MCRKNLTGFRQPRTQEADVVVSNGGQYRAREECWVVRVRISC